MTDRLINPFSNLVSEHALFHPAHGEQVIEGSKQAVPDTVMALAGEPGIVGYRNLGHGEAFDLEERGQKTMHAFEKFHVLDALALESAISAAGIADLFAGEFVPHPVRNTRRRDADEVISRASRFDARAADAIRLLQPFKKFREVLRIILQVRVERDQVSSSRGFKAR